MKKFLLLMVALLLLVPSTMARDNGDNYFKVWITRDNFENSPGSSDTDETIYLEVGDKIIFFANDAGINVDHYSLDWKFDKRRLNCNLDFPGWGGRKMECTAISPKASTVLVEANVRFIDGSGISFQADSLEVIVEDNYQSNPVERYDIGWSKKFNDVRIGSESSPTPYWNAINWTAENRIVEGYPDGTFRPDSCVNRVEFAKMLVLAKKLDMHENGLNAYFSDVNENAWYMPYVNAVVSAGAAQGYPDGTFRPGNCVNRVEAIKMTMETFFPKIHIQVQVNSPVFNDNNSREWYYGYLSFAGFNQLVGTSHLSNNNYRPADSMSRKEVAEMLYRARAAADNNRTNYNTSTLPKK